VLPYRSTVVVIDLCPSQRDTSEIGTPSARAVPAKSVSEIMRCHVGGELDEAVTQGVKPPGGERKSLPSLLMVRRDLTKVLKEPYPAETETRDYLDQLATLTASPAAS
jgi:hypothetical protein